MSEHKFRTSLGEKHWDADVGGWRCEALLIPEIKVDALYHNGAKADTKKYSIENEIVRWTGINRPKQLSLSLTITKDLLNIEAEKLELQKQNSSTKNKLSLFAASAGIISGCITFGATFLLLKICYL